ncbi:MAG TPA: FAD-linked oxidase C-terminal domain-containing protein [Bryobacteraceae bacterium]|nr:FAD-linked oxidase C-terminal domain-containing protein [Bryobacteraceae bacterium]
MNEGLRQALEAEIEGEVRFDKISRALYSTDASVYQIEPAGVVIPKSQEDIIRAMRICARLGCSITMRGGGTSQAGQAIGAGLQIDCSKYVNRLLEVDVEQRWARVEPGIVLDELNALLKPHGLRFAPDISTASRATVGGMIANNSAGARSVLYGKTIDHVLEQKVLLTDGSVVEFRPLSDDELEANCIGDTLEAECYRTVRRVARENTDEVELRYPKVLRRVGGYNLDEFIHTSRPFNLSKLMVGSEGTLAILLEAKINLVPLPKHKSVLAIEFETLLDALGATPTILLHKPSAVEVMDRFILEHTRENPTLLRIRNSFLQGEPGALLCVEFYADEQQQLRPRMEAVERDLAAVRLGTHFYYAMDPPAQARIWSLREAALGLSMAMKEDAKSISFVEDTAVAPERLRDFIDRFLAVIHKHGTVAGVYAHASVGCLHVRPVVNMKTAEGVRKFEAIANDVSDLVLEFGGALSGEHGDGLVRSPFMKKMFGAQLYDAFRTIKHTFDPHGLLNPGKIVDAPPLTGNLRFGAGYKTPNPLTFFDYSEYGGMGGAVEMCSGVGACRKKIEGTMCPSYMATRDEKHTTRGRANVLRLAMAGRLGESGLGDEGVKEVLDLCLECRACKAECPVGVDMARFKSEFLADYYQRHGTPVRASILGHAHRLAVWGSRLAPFSNWVARSAPARWLNERIAEIDARRMPPKWTSHPLRSRVKANPQAEVLLFCDTFTNYYHPEVGEAAIRVLPADLTDNVCCGRPLISQGLLGEARRQAARNAEILSHRSKQGRPILFLEPSCLSAVKEDAPSLLRGVSQNLAKAVAARCFLWEEYVEAHCSLNLKAGPREILLHGHCHQKSMGLLAPAKALLSRIPNATVTDLDGGCCGMAGSFGYIKGHYEVSRAIGERKLLPAARKMAAETVLVASGVSCRHQVEDLAGKCAQHPATLLASLIG